MATAHATLVRDVLEEYGNLTNRGVRAYLDRQSDTPELTRLAADYPSRRGRSLRASLCIASARAFGASVDDAVQSAISLELLHNAFLVHDDVEDESEERRGQPTLHVMHGVPTAVNVGDGLAVLSLAPLIDNRFALGPRLAFRVLSEAQRMALESVQGQAVELRWRTDNEINLSDDDYLRMVLKKTCWYTTIYPCRVGALIGTGDQIDLDHFVRFGFFLGAAFQIQDDLLNLTGDYVKYGKEIGGDIKEGKRTISLIHLLNSAPPDVRGALRDLLGLTRHERTDLHVQWVIDMMERYGSIDYARKAANELAGAAAFEFSLAFASAQCSRDRDFIEALPHWMLERA